MERARRWRPDRRDVALAVVVAGVLAASASRPDDGVTDLDALGYVLIVVMGLVLVARRRAPAAVLVVVAACLLAYQVRGYPEIAGLALMVAVYNAVRVGHRWLTVGVAGAALVTGALAANPLGDEASRDLVEHRFTLIGWVVAAGVLAEVSRHREAYVREVEERAAEAERTRDETARRRATEERLRIARELHDSLTHSLSVIKVQAGVAVHLAHKRGETVPEALLAIQEASRDATRELRATLDVLRAGAPGLDGLGETTGLARLGELVERAGAGGVPATVTVTGDERRLPPDVDRAAYRIVQEALTNVGRHAGPASASIGLDYGVDRLIVQVDDDGRATAAAPPVPGTGLIGMRERVAALGGRLGAGPRPEGGFTVRAELPIALPAELTAGDLAGERPTGGTAGERATGEPAGGAQVPGNGARP